MLWLKNLAVQYLLPKLLDWAQQTIPILASNAFQDIIDKIKEKKECKMSAIEFTVKNSSIVISGATISLTIPGVGASTKITDTTGKATFSGLTAGETYSATISATGYEAKTVLTAISTDATVESEVELSPKSAADIAKDAAASIGITSGTVAAAGDAAQGAINQAVNDGITHAESSAHAASSDEEKRLATEVATPGKSDWVKARDSAEIALCKVADAGADDAIVALAAKAFSAISALLKKI